MTYFKKCPNCDEKGTFWTHRNIYECKKCDHIFCDKCTAGGRCPECASKDVEKIGEVQ